MTRTRAHINALQRAAYARRSPELVEKRKAYLREWHRQRNPEPIKRVAMTPAERLAHRAKAERERNAKLTPEQRRARRARFPSRQRKQAAPAVAVPREPVLTLPVVRQPRPPKAPRTPNQVAMRERIFAETTQAKAPAAPRFESVDEWMARTGQQPEQLPAPSFEPRHGALPCFPGTR